MLRTRGKRLIVAMAGVAALTLIGAAPGAGQQTPAYVRINVFVKSTVYLEFQGNDLRAAMSVEGLRTAQPAKMLVLKAGDPGENYPEITLPIPADQLPAGIKAVKATCAFPRSGHVSGVMMDGLAYVHIAIYRTDGNKTQWEYDLAPGSQTGPSPESAPVIQLPNLDNVKARLEATPTRGKLAIGLRVTDGTAELTDVRKDGRPVQVKMTVADASGAEIASKAGTLADFGFS
jgi:hypothetical protein